MLKTIKEFLQSSDQEIRLLGLSYLNDNKDSNSILFNKVWECPKDFTERNIVWKRSFKYGISARGITYRIKHHMPIEEELLNIYLKYCYEREN